MNTIDEIQCASADELLTALRRSNKRWCHGFEVPWVFRGQTNADWSLVPAAYRQGQSRSPFFVYLYDLAQKGFESWRNRDNFIADEVKQFVPLGEGQQPSDAQLRNAREALCVSAVENVAVGHFLEMVNSLGLVVPGGEFSSQNPFRFLKDKPHPGFALAQHHGCPTRLLDWTFNPMFAAYFAVADVDPQQDGRFAVWAMRTDRAWGDWKPFRVPHSQVTYLHAQQGLFVYREDVDGHFIRNGRWPSLDDEVPGVALLKVTAHNRHSPEVLRMLWAEGISLAHLMPSHDNITRTITLHWKRIGTGFFDQAT